jgi:lipopolysaccharide/colanic/teichoic acid biosynthesis glycosyltransferase
MKLDCVPQGWHVPSIWSKMSFGVLYLMAFLVSLAFLHGQYYSRRFLILLAAFLSLGFIVIRYAFRFVITTYCRARMWRRVVIIGNGRLGEEVKRKIAQHPEMMLDVLGFLNPYDADSPANADFSRPGSTSAQTLEVPDLLQRLGVQDLIVVLHNIGTEARKLICACRNAGMGVSFIPESYELYISKIGLQELDGLPLLSLEDRSLSSFALMMKRADDLLLGALFLIILSPLLACGAIALYWHKHKAFRNEIRCGKDGHSFLMHRLNLDKDAPDLKGYERLLVELSLTELPQLWNVLRGEMSLVGPRPEPPDRVKHYSDWQHLRLSVKPGLTGLAQVHGLREENSSEEKSCFDMQYILGWSFFWDHALILQTAWTLFKRLKNSGPVSSDRRDEDTIAYSIMFSEVANVDSAKSGTD